MFSYLLLNKYLKFILLCLIIIYLCFEIKASENKIIFMYSGSMNQKQGVEILAELATYDFNNKNIFWIFAGEGPSKKILLEKTKNKKSIW